MSLSGLPRRGSGRPDEVRLAAGLEDELRQIVDHNRAISRFTQQRIVDTATELGLNKELRNTIQQITDEAVQRRDRISPKGITAALSVEIGQAGKVTKDMVQRMFAEMDQLEPGAQRRTRRMAMATLRELREMGVISQDEFRRGRRLIEREEERKARRVVRQNMTMVGALQGIYAHMNVVTGGALGQLGRLVENALKALGVNTNFKLDAKTLGSGIGTVVNVGRQIFENKAQGGFIGRPGEAGGDNVPLLVPPDWAIANRHQQAVIARGMQAIGYAKGGLVPVLAGRGEMLIPPEDQGPMNAGLSAIGMRGGLSELFDRVTTPHYMAKGGFTFRRPSNDPAGPFESHKERVNVSIIKQVENFISRYKANLTAAYNPGGHDSAGHNVTGTATDFVPGPGGSWDLLERGLRFLVSKGLTVLYGSNGVGTPYPNHGRDNHAHVEWGSAGVAGGIRGGAAAVERIKRLKIRGPAGGLRDLAQGAADTVRKAANRKLTRAAAAQGATSSPRAVGKHPRGKAGGGSALRGKVSVFGPPLEGAGTTAYGYSSAQPGIAVNPDGGSNTWNNERALSFARRVMRVTIGGKSANLRVIDKGPSIPGRIIDVTGAGARKMGIDPARFPTDSIGEAVLVRARGGFIRAAKGKKPSRQKGGKGPKVPGAGPKVQLGSQNVRVSNVLKGLPFFSFLRRVMEHNIPAIEERYGARQALYDSTDETFIVGEGAEQRQKVARGHQLEQIGSSWIDWSDVNQRVSELRDLHGIESERGSLVKGASEAARQLVTAVVAGIKWRREEIERVKKRVKENLKRITALRKKINKEQQKKPKNRDKKAIRRWQKEIEALQSENVDLVGAGGDPQGSGGYVGKLKLGDWEEAQRTLEDDQRSLSGVAGEGGLLADVTNNLRSLSKEMSELTGENLRLQIDPATPDDSGLAELLKQQNEQLKKQLLVGDTQGAVIKEFLAGIGMPYLGAFKTGGVLPADGFYLGHKGETVVPADTSPGPTYITLRGVAAIDDRIDARISRTAPGVVDRAMGRDARTIRVAPGG